MKHSEFCEENFEIKGALQILPSFRNLERVYQHPEQDVLCVEVDNTFNFPSFIEENNFKPTSKEGEWFFQKKYHTVYLNKKAL